MQREDLTARVTKNLDPDLLDFLAVYADSFVKWDLLRFFHENPSTMDTAENIARYVGRSVRDVQPELKALARHGLLVERLLDTLTVYILHHDTALRTRLAAFIKATQDREFRRKVIYHMVRQ
jgi:hypothetical protein